jgi:hypothetical protein
VRVEAGIMEKVSLTYKNEFLVSYYGSQAISSNRCDREEVS